MPTVNLGKLREIASREFRRSPRKCLILILMIPIALYFWVPVVRKWTRHGAPIAATPPSLPRTPVESTASNPAVKGATGTAASDFTAAWNAIAVNWSEVVEQMNQDPRKKSIGWSEDQRNPFQTGDRKPVLNLPPSVDSEPEAVSVDRERLQRELKLEGTLVGGRRPVATINGRALAEGETVSVQKLGIRFQGWRTVSLVSVTADRAVLRCGAQIVALELPKLNKPYYIHTDSDADGKNHD